MYKILEKKGVMFEYRNASNQLTFDFDKINSLRYKKITNSVIKYFNLQATGRLIIGIDEMLQDVSLDDLMIGLEWDNWAGYTIRAKNQEAELLLREIAQYINDRW